MLARAVGLRSGVSGALARGSNATLARRSNTTLACRIDRARSASFLRGVNEREAVLLLQYPLIIGGVLKLRQVAVNLWQVEAEAVLLGGARRLAASRDIPTLTTGVRPPLGRGQSTGRATRIQAACLAQFPPEGVGKSRPPVGAPIADVSLTSGAGGASSPPGTAGVISVTDAIEVAGLAGKKACWPAP